MRRMQYNESENQVTYISYSKYEYFLSGVLESIWNTYNGNIHAKHIQNMENNNLFWFIA